MCARSPQATLIPSQRSVWVEWVVYWTSVMFMVFGDEGALFTPDVLPERETGLRRKGYLLIIIGISSG